MSSYPSRTAPARNVLILGGMVLILFGAILLFCPSVTHDGKPAFFIHRVDFPSPFEMAIQLLGVIFAAMFLFFFMGCWAISFLNIIVDRFFRITVFAPVNIYHAIIASFITSIVLIILLVYLARVFGISPSNDASKMALMTSSLGTFAIATGMIFKNKHFDLPLPDTPRSIFLSLLAGTLILIVLLLSSQLWFNQLSDDEQEAVQFSLSLASHPLPYWDIGGVEWGFYFNFLLFSFPMYVLSATLGDSEFIFRMFFFICMYITVVSAAAIFEILSHKAILIHEISIFLLGTILISIVAACYNTWHPFISGLAEPSGVDMFGMALFLGSVYSFYNRNYVLFLAYAWAQLAALPNGPFYTLAFIFFSGVLSSIRAKQAINLAAAYAAGALLYWGLYNYYLPVVNEFSLVNFGDRYFSRLSDIQSTGRFLFLILVLSGGSMVPMLISLWWGSNKSRALTAFVSANVAAGASFYSLQHIHYYLPLLPLVYAIGIYGIQLLVPKHQTTWNILVFTGMCSAILFFVPSERPAFDSARRLGEHTKIVCGTRDLKQLYGAVDQYYEKELLKDYGITLESWIYYSLKSSARAEKYIIIADSGARVPGGYMVVGGNASCKVMAWKLLDMSEYEPCYTYRNERAWTLLASPRWQNRLRQNRQFRPSAAANC